jgi:asparagine synthase (glutamine-hydrolysing)
MPDRFIFATNIRLILASGYITPEVDEDGLVEFFSIGRVLPPRCLFTAIKKLIPGHILKCRKNEVSSRRVYGFSFSPKIRQESYHTIDSLFAESIRKNLVADKSPAFLLSGGLDSSLNVAMASRVYDRPVTTVSLGFGDDVYDESSHARTVAEYFKADHHVHILDSSDALEILPQLVWCEEEPIADTSSVPSYHLAGFAKKLADVVIAGDGPDHLWGRKYFMLQRFRLARLLLVPQIFRRLITSLAPVRFSSSYPVKVIQRLGQYANKTVEEMYLEILACELGNPHSLKFLPELLSRSFKNRWDNVSSIEGLIPDDIRDGFDRLVAFDFLVDGSFGVFTKFGKIAAEQSLGVREPYLDTQLVDFITHLPDEFRVRGSLRQRIMFSAETKYLMRRNLADKILPRESLQKPKAGFTPPMTGWLREYFSRGNMNAEILLGKSLKQSGYFNIEYVEQLINECRDGSRRDSSPLYMLLMFALWYRIYINNPGTLKPSATLTELISDQT